ncbi:hypothetical protein ACWDZ6_30475 [Streptomyces sp. NPDC002926]
MPKRPELAPGRRTLQRAQALPGETTAEAVDCKKRHDDGMRENSEVGLAGLAFITDVDFSGYDVDVPIQQLAATSGPTATRTRRPPSWTPPTGRCAR